MANRNAPTGLRPAFHLTGGLIRVNGYKIASAYGTNIFTGDLVQLAGTSKTVTAVTAVNAVPHLGVFWGCSYRDTTGAYKFSKYWPASTATLGSALVDCFVYDDPMIIFEVQGSGTHALADIGQIADIKYTAGSTATGCSKVELDTSTMGSGDELYIYDFVPRADNEVGANTKIWVALNRHLYRNAGAASFTQT